MEEANHRSLPSFFSRIPSQAAKVSRERQSLTLKWYTESTIFFKLIQIELNKAERNIKKEGASANEPADGPCIIFKLALSRSQS